MLGTGGREFHPLLDHRLLLGVARLGLLSVRKSDHTDTYGQTNHQHFPRHLHVHISISQTVTPQHDGSLPKVVPLGESGGT